MVVSPSLPGAKVLNHLRQASGKFYLVLPQWDSAWWISQVCLLTPVPPLPVPDLHLSLVDLRTNKPPPKVEDLQLQVWLISLPLSTTHT